MVQEINLIVRVLGETSLESQIATPSMLDRLKLNASNKIPCKNSINLLSSCDNCFNTVQLNLYWNGEWKFEVSKNEVHCNQTNIKEEEEEEDSNLDADWHEPEVLFFKEESMEEVFTEVKSEPRKDPPNLVSVPGVNYPLPTDLILPCLTDIRAPFFAEMVRNDGTLFYIERKYQKFPVRVLNYDPRSTTCDICKYEVPMANRMTAHRKIHFFDNYSKDYCPGCGMYFGESSMDDIVNHTFFCPGKHTINALKCPKCDYQAKDYKQQRAHIKLCNKSSTEPSEDTKQPVKKRVESSNGWEKYKIDEYKSYLNLPKDCVLPNLIKLRAQHGQMHPQPDGTSIYVSKTSNNIQIMNFNPRKKSCDVCGKGQFQSKPDLVDHRYNIHFFPNGAESCQGCQRKFPSSEAKIAHSHFCDQKHKIKVNFCKICNEQFPIHFKYFTHMKNFHKCDGIDLKYMCHLCSMGFERMNLLESHMSKHKDPKPYKCAHCDAEFKGRHGLETHLIRTHFPHVAKYTCNICSTPTLFGSQKYYKAHLYAAHSNTSRNKVTCPYCKKRIRGLGLTQHIKQQHTNTGEKEKFECPDCKKVFFNKRALVAHSTIHLPEDQKRFRCRFCGRSFNFKRHLIEHERSHTGEKPFECETCGKAFTRRTTLKDHQREHTGQGYPCSVCSRIFIDRGNYRHHMKQHESQLGVKLTFNHEERRLMRLKVLTAEQALKSGLGNDFGNY